MLLAAGSFALSGHTRSTDNELLAVSAAIVHTVTAAVWFGGLVLLAVVLWGRRDEDEHTSSAGMVGRFSRVATVCVLAVGAAGVALSWSEVRALRALTSTTYGWTLLAKVGVVLVVGLIGAHNRFRVVPAIRRSPSATRAWSLLRKSVRLEAAALVVAIALTAVLVNVTPARSAAGIGEIFSETVALGRRRLGEHRRRPESGGPQRHPPLLLRRGRPAGGDRRRRQRQPVAAVRRHRPRSCGSPSGPAPLTSRSTGTSSSPVVGGPFR